MKSGNLTITDYEEFATAFPLIVDSMEDIKHLNGKERTKPDIATIMEYNIPHGKQSRGLLVVSAFKYMSTQKSDCSDVQLACILGWCVEIFQAFALVVDDVMDQSETRRGKPCWYMLHGFAAINDGLILNESAYQLMRKYFGDEDFYSTLLDLFHDAAFKTTLGQNLDNRAGDIKGFTMERYSEIVRLKTSYYTYCLPIYLGATLAGREDLIHNPRVNSILKEIGHLFQVQDDFLDCFGDPAVTGKIGTDIKDGKCTWLAVVALQKATRAQRQLLEESYGHAHQHKIDKVKLLYEELELSAAFKTYEEESYLRISKQIESLPKDLPQPLFQTILEAIFKRRR